MMKPETKHLIAREIIALGKWMLALAIATPIFYLVSIHLGLGGKKDPLAIYVLSPLLGLYIGFCCYLGWNALKFIVKGVIWSYRWISY